MNYSVLFFILLSLDANTSPRNDLIPSVPDLLDSSNRTHGLNLENVHMRANYFYRKTNFGDVSVQILNLQRQKAFYCDLIKQRKNLELSIKFCGKALGSPRGSPRETSEITRLRQGFQDEIGAVDAMMAYSKRFQEKATNDIMETLGLTQKQINFIPPEED